MRQPISKRLRLAMCVMAGVTSAGLAYAQTPSRTPKVDNRGPGTAASDVAPGAAPSGVRKEGHRTQGGGAAVNQGASSAQTYDYPASAPKTPPAKRP